MCDRVSLLLSAAACFISSLSIYNSYIVLGVWWLPVIIAVAVLVGVGAIVLCFVGDDD